MTTDSGRITGVAAGVPFVALAPAGGPRPTAPVVVAWHLLDAPRTEAAFAAALPLGGLDAWRIYLGLPMSGSRAPAGGAEEIARLVAEDVVMNVHGPITAQAVEEFGPAFGELRTRLGLGDDPIGIVGGSLGGAVAQLVLAESPVPVAAAVLVNPVVRLRAVVDALGRAFGVTYPWSARSLAVADRLDFVARADEIARRGETPVLMLLGADDNAEAFHTPAHALHDALAARYAYPGRVRLQVIPGVAHALADEPGIEPAPQTPAAAAVDRYASFWLHEYLL